MPGAERFDPALALAAGAVAVPGLAIGLAGLLI
jgi:hypothetical protein